MSALTVRGLTKGFGGTAVLRGVDLDVPERSITAVLGPSGCGKTTLLRLVAGFDDPDAGSIAFGEQLVFGSGRSAPAQRRRVGYVPQEGALFPHLDVGDNITFGLPRSARRRQSRVAELCRLVGLDESVARRQPHELSGGQQQRVALARALAPEPALVLLDEPFSSLDAGLREGTRRAVAHALREARATAVIVTHDQAEALSLADQVAVMRDGRLVQVDDPTSVYEAPADVGVARFVGEAVVLPAQVVAGRAHCALGALELATPAADGAATVLVRPEQVLLRTPPGRTGATAKVLDTSYYGHDASVRLRVLPDGPTVTARVMGSDVPGADEVLAVGVAGGVRVVAETSGSGAGVGRAG